MHINKSSIQNTFIYIAKRESSIYGAVFCVYILKRLHENRKQ